MAAMSSMRLLVVKASAPETSLRSLPATSRAAQPPGPGLPRHAPSVNSSTWVMARLGESRAHFGCRLCRADQHALTGTPSRPHQGHGLDALAGLEQVGAGHPRRTRPGIGARQPALRGQRAEIAVDAIDVEAQDGDPITQP